MVVNKAIRSLKVRGVKGTVRRIITGSDPVAVQEKNDVLGFWSFISNTTEIPFNNDEYEQNKNNGIVLNWIVPEMGPGSGGHINIFRFVSYLERHGIHNRVYLHNPHKFTNNEEFRDFIAKYFKILDKSVELYCDVKYMHFAHGTVATGWDTAYFLRRFNNTISKFYFVQDFEPYFYAHGSEYEFAENTYKFGFRAITAGDWLKNICINEYGLKAESFGFSYDKALYTPKMKTNPTKRIFFYARPVTPRRDFELGLIALNELCKRMPDVEVVFAGWDVSGYKIPFKHENLGIKDICELSELYASCDMCFVLSNTNLSLLPLEVMASGSVAVCSKGPNSEWLVNEENSILVEYDPIKIADTLEYYLNNPKELAKIREKGISFAQGTSWNEEGEKVKQCIMRGIAEDEESINYRG